MSELLRKSLTFPRLLHLSGDRPDVAARVFDALPAHVQDAMWRKLRADVEYERWLDDSPWSDEPPPEAGFPLEPVRLPPPRPQVLANGPAARVLSDLTSIPSRVYFERLTGIAVPRSGMVRCPLPNHDDRGPSCKVYEDTQWRCFGCGAWGNVLDLWSALHGGAIGRDLRGAEFCRVRDELAQIFRLAEAA